MVAAIPPLRSGQDAAASVAMTEEFEYARFFMRVVNGYTLKNEERISSNRRAPSKSAAPKENHDGRMVRLMTSLKVGHHQADSCNFRVSAACAGAVRGAVRLVG